MKTVAFMNTRGMLCIGQLVTEEDFQDNTQGCKDFVENHSFSTTGFLFYRLMMVVPSQQGMGIAPYTQNWADSEFVEIVEHSIEAISSPAKELAVAYENAAMQAWSKIDLSAANVTPFIRK